MKKIDKRIIIGICAILTACLLVFIVLPMLIKSQESKAIVVRLIKDVPAHGRITADCIEEAEVKNYNLSPEVIRSADGVVGKYATQDMYAGMYVVKEQLAEQPAQKNAYLWDRSDRVVSIDIDGFANGLSGKLEAGDIVSIVANTDNGSEYIKELQFMEILAVTADTGSDVDAQTRAETDAPAASMTLACTEQQALKLIDCSANGSVYVVFVYRGDPSECREYLDRQQEILEDLAACEAAGTEGATDESAADESE